MSGEEKETQTLWLSLKKSFQNCKSEPAAAASGPTPKRNLCSSTCSRSLSNLRDVIHGSKRHSDDDNNRKVLACSPRSLGSGDFLNPVTHEVVLSDTTAELKITMLSHDSHPSPVALTSPEILRRKVPAVSLGYGGGEEKPSRFRSDGHCDDGVSTLTCRKCGKQFKKAEEVEEHQVSDHAVSELIDGDSSRRIVEIIFRTSWPKSESNPIRIERVFKVNNTRTTLSHFEQHREKVKLRATKLLTKHPRCLADGNELLRFHGTTVACSLGTTTTNGPSSSILCRAEECGVCRILRRGFSLDRRNAAGVFTASTSKRALEEASGDCGRRKALVLCRVIAGRVHKPVENVEEMMIGSRSVGFDSVAGKIGQHSSVEELYLLDPKALLPCFVVICRP
ncbi:unnamed protein product [Linum tenue]|uniref:C2H2-type domain-containing protein n=1 Tax=Linum tenue TaxID=586396 RepID=A0AAV0PB59_9ROSI|nr:unnamed protein product [Linum tenue]